MPIYERNDIKGWYFFTFGGLILGFLIGLLIANTIESEQSKYYLYGSMVSGILLGIGLAYWADKKWNMDKWFVPTYRSPDLDDSQDTFIDTTKDDSLIQNLTQYTDYELIILITYRYTDLLKETKVLLKNELLKRAIDKNRFNELFNQIKTFDFRKYGICPKCGYENYIVKTPQDKINCILCGYNDNIENPRLFLNKLNKLFGYYDDKKLDWETIENTFYYK